MTYRDYYDSPALYREFAVPCYQRLYGGQTSRFMHSELLRAEHLRIASVAAAPRSQRRPQLQGISSHSRSSLAMGPSPRT